MKALLTRAGEIGLDQFQQIVSGGQYDHPTGIFHGGTRPTWSYRWLDEKDLSQTIGRLSAFMGNTGVLLRAYVYMRMLGREGMHHI